MRIAFCHPDLGLGGAERLVVDAALELQSRGHTVAIYTAYHDPKRCFSETRDGTLSVHVHGNWLPRSLFGKAHALCATLRCLIVALAICRASFDAVFVDQVSNVLPVFKLLRPSTRILFYCHFPDLLLSKKGSRLKALYRWFMDALESWTTGMADRLLVNSAFTEQIFKRTFERLRRQDVRILHPAVSIPSDAVMDEGAASWNRELSADLATFLSDAEAPVFLSINRFEKKKHLHLAIQALQKLDSVSDGRARLVMAGGYDSRIEENKQVLEELKILAKALKLEDRVFFVPSFSDRQKGLLLSACIAVIYTPPNEHFGIVPLESMAFARPVIACDSGGPKESIVNGVTGFLAMPTPDAFAQYMDKLMKLPDYRLRMGQSGRKHVQHNFSRGVFGQKLNDIVVDLVQKKDQ